MSEDAPRQYRFVYDLTADDYVTFIQAAQDVHPMARPQALKYRQSIRTVLYAAAFLLVVVLLLGWHARENPSFTGWALTGFFAGLLALILLYAHQLHKGLKPQQIERAARARIRSPGFRFTLGPRTLAVSAQQVHEAGEFHENYTQWQMFSSITELGDCVTLDQNNARCYIIPVRVFASPSERQQFVADTNKWMLAAHGGDPQRILRHIAGADTKCTSCGYNLRGVADLRCPECGLGLNRYTLPAVFAEWPTR
jgi:hypothetical protein